MPGFVPIFGYQFVGAHNHSPLWFGNWHSILGANSLLGAYDDDGLTSLLWVVCDEPLLPGFVSSA